MSTDRHFIAASPKQMQAILEALLHCSCLDVNHTAYAAQQELMIGMAISIRGLYPQIFLENIFVVKDQASEPEKIELLSKWFPEIILT